MKNLLFLLASYNGKWDNKKGTKSAVAVFADPLSLCSKVQRFVTILKKKGVYYGRLKKPKIGKWGHLDITWDGSIL